MKKIIAISVMFVLLTGAVFAVDIGGTVIGRVDVLKGDTGKDENGDAIKVTSGAEMKRLRFEGSGAAGDSFGGWLRLGDGDEPGFNGYAWWKPIDQLKLIIGGQPDGFWGKEGVTGWGFTQMITDTGVVDAGDNVWGGGGMYGQGLKFRNAFFGGYGSRGLLLEITPADIASINIAIPAFDGGETGDVFKAAVAQLDLHLDFGNIAITYNGSPSYIQEGNVGWGNAHDGALIYVYAGITAIENLGLDVGFSYQLANEDDTKNPIAAGLGVKYSADSFGVKLRVVGSFAGEDKATKVLADVLPFFVINDSLRAFVSVGLGMTMPDQGDNVMDWHFNPYLEVGGEWGPTFYAGIKVKSANNGDSIGWSVPIALGVSF